MAERAEKEAFVTLATNDTYALGCLVLGNSLRLVQTTRQLVVMLTSSVTDSMRNQLSRVFDLLYDVNLLDSQDERNLQLLGRPDLNVTFTKFHCWRLTMYDKAVFLDADTLVLQNVDELFVREELSAAPDAGWPDCFNSGVFVFRPSETTYAALLDYAMSKGSFDGGDQGLLNMYFRDWATKDIARHLPFIYNVVSQAFYSYLPALTQFKQDVKIVHFIGATKPWHHPYNTGTRQVQPLAESGHSQEYLQRWWDVFMKNVQPALDPSLYPGIVQIESSQTCSSEQKSPMTTVQAVFPYVPPSLEAAQDSKQSSSPQVVEMPVLPRSYTLPESHHSETPMSISSDFPKQDIYDISKVVKTWADLNVQQSSSNDEQNLQVQNENQEYFAPEMSSDNQELSAPEAGDSLSSSDKTKDSEGGLIGELAAMSIQSEVSGSGFGNGQNLSDSERRLNWEKGQADYLGADKFENIQKKLEESLQGPATESEGATSSPFQSKAKSTGKESSKK